MSKGKVHFDTFQYGHIVDGQYWASMIVSAREVETGVLVRTSSKVIFTYEKSQNRAYYEVFEFPGRFHPEDVDRAEVSADKVPWVCERLGIELSAHQRLELLARQ